MSEGSAKKLKQLRLPFALLASPEPSTSPKTVDKPSKSSPKTPKTSRKRKTSNEGDQTRSTKIGRTNSKENIATEPPKQEIVEIVDSSDEAESTPAEEVLHIKLPSKRKTNTDGKSQDESLEDLDDSIVYLDQEEIKKSCKKSKKKSKKKESEAKKAKKLLSLSESKEEAEEGPEIPEASSPEEEKTFSTIPSNASSPKAEDPEAIHDEICEVLSDNSEESGKDSKSPTEDACKTPGSSKLDISKLTPKQLARRQELEVRRIEKEKQRQLERDLREQQRLKEKEMRDEAKRKEKEEKEEARKREKEEREKKRLAEQEKKDEEKRAKEEERKKAADQREEEKRLKEEERKRQLELRDEEKRKRDEAQKKKELEEELRKKRAAEAFSKFFVPKKRAEQVVSVDETSKESAESGESMKLNFMPFQVRERMMLAPLVRFQLSRDQKEKLEEVFKSSNSSELYLRVLKSGNYKPKSMKSTWPAEDKEDDVVVVDELEGAGEDIQVDEAQLKMKHRAKFLLFHENRRPAFYGTWRKNSQLVSARRPFGQEKRFFDYEVDSDEEWEEEEPGESLHGSDSEKEKDAPEDDYEVDNDFFVPHGHLSEEEMNVEDAEDDDDNRPETQNAKLKIRQQEFAAEMKKKTEKIKPRLIGCIWMNGDEDENGCTMDKNYHCSDIIWRILKAREAWTSDEGIKLEENFEPEIVEVGEEDAPKTPAQQKTQVRGKFNEDSVKELVRLVHGNLNNKKFIIREFQAFRLKNYHKDPDFLEFSVKSVDEKMMEISDYKTCPDEGPLFGKKCWYVKAEVMQEHFGEEKLKLPNEWTYILEKEKKVKPVSSVDGAKKEQIPAADEIVEEKPQPSGGAVVKKRVQLLMSVPRGQPISETKKNHLINQYLKTGAATKAQADAEKKKTEDEVVVID